MPHSTNPLSIGSPDIVNAALAVVQRHEGFSQFPYLDSVGNTTIGYGTNLTVRGITKLEASLIARSEITKLVDRLSTLSWWNCLNTPRSCVILDIAYAVGFEGLLEFRRMIDDISRMDFISAATEILMSKFAKQDRSRAREDALIMHDGSLKEATSE